MWHVTSLPCSEASVPFWLPSSALKAPHGLALPLQSCPPPPPRDRRHGQNKPRHTHACTHTHTHLLTHAHMCNAPYTRWHSHTPPMHTRVRAHAHPLFGAPPLTASLPTTSLSFLQPYPRPAPPGSVGSGAPSMLHPGAWHLHPSFFNARHAPHD